MVIWPCGSNPDYFEQKGWQIAERVQHLGVVGEATTTAEYLRLALDYSGNPRQLERLIEAEDKAVEVVSMGHNLEIIKQVGSPENLNATFGFSRLAGSHGIGHHPPLHDAVPRTCG
jgi:methylamine---glutamate N-methyltransferase subunit A